jgi:transposase-like protein
MEGLGTSRRHWLRPFRGVSKRYFQDYVAALGWGSNRERVDKEELWKIVSTGVGKELFS